ncbi:endolytic transglycosylase MltG [Paenibacillus sp. URB8-2]|uniref:endolytic transglycosylase MltG n=1 Tax=Paenibacillus sp. URB8-2 TaxID=2741301 RepID=UPI0015BC5F54|nr:endolytic transglycosylase MltG [Paenibacillus sp. URB8-2]BCG59657.1 hypothetical protein PUR_30820 [Paenibacillus sp. URB8-2]
MIKNRSFMIGLGCGLAGGALLLQLMISAGMATPTKAQIIREATKLNLKVSGAEDKLLTAEEWQKLAQQNSSSQEQNAAGAANGDAAASGSPGANKQPASPPGKAVSPTGPSSPSQPSAAEIQEQSATAVPPTAPAADSPASSSIVVRIPSGVTLTEVADLLAEAGVIQDKNLFLIEGTGRKVQTRIQYGLYRFTAGQSNESIIDELITVKE